jgi:dCMP deaminase
MTRPTLDQTYMQVARAFAKRATCARRQVGAVITGNGYILSSGYNGSFPGSKHCIDVPCAGAGLPSGTGLDLCMSAHAEQNAIARLRQVDEADTLYCTTAPCISCTKLALCTGIKRIVADQDYATSGKELWVLAGRVWSQYAD